MHPKTDLWESSLRTTLINQLILNQVVGYIILSDSHTILAKYIYDTNPFITN